MTKTINPDFRWAIARDKVKPLVRFFIENAPTEYISHGEIQDGRASSVGVWAKNLESVLLGEFKLACRGEGDGKHGETRLALAYKSGTKLAGFSYIGIERSAQTPYAVVCDLLILTGARGRGIGSDLLRWIEKQLRSDGIKHLFLESGTQNVGAHRFFERFGFSPVSVNMMKAL